MPTSVLLAVLAAASLLALAPALVRRYDATERLVAERTSSTARVLARQRRRRTVPGRTPVNPPLAVLQAATDGPVATGSDAAVRSGAARAGAAGDGAGAGRGHDPVVPRPRDPVD
ncbi:MAG: hypothetical protein ACRDT4_22170, partial [Micromonosporaceae bacterium]